MWWLRASSSYSSANEFPAKPIPTARKLADVVNYIEVFYNAKHPHGYTNSVSPIEFET
jgi:hypothetical protein